MNLTRSFPFLYRPKSLDDYLGKRRKTKGKRFSTPSVTARKILLASVQISSPNSIKTEIIAGKTGRYIFSLEYKERKYR